MGHNLSISEQLAYSTVRIVARLKAGGASVGTGFFFRFLEDGERHVPALVTNKHVVEGSDQVTFLVHETAKDESPHPTDNVTVCLSGDNLWIGHPNPDVDLCILPVAAHILEAEKQGKRSFYIALHPSLIPTDAEIADLTAIEDLVMVGYPIGIWDSANNMPVIRRGITATHPAKDYEGLAQFLIDAACFPGSSGSPVFLFNLGSFPKKSGGLSLGTRVKLLGILYAGPRYNAKGEIQIENVPTAQKLVAFSSLPVNLGVVIRGKRLLDFESVLKAIP